jgi:light-regulated signal transduction histidine kinase (bacteriophytochrome)
LSARPVDLTTCDREPVHLAGAIQPFGALLVLDGEERLVRRSANAAGVLGTLPELGRPLAAPFAGAFRHWFEQRAHGPEALEPLELEAADCTLDVVAHRSGSGLLLELEPRAADAPSLAAFAVKAQRALERIQRQPTLAALLDTATEELRNLTGFDRVMASASCTTTAATSLPSTVATISRRFSACAIPRPTSPCRRAAFSR